ncbi:MAG: hypothetical protein U0174_20820 [Polyangiaceae bacterium]
MYLGLLRAVPAFLVTFLVPLSAWASSSDELVRGGERAEQTGDTDSAIRRYTEAITLDGQHEQAYLHLGALRLKLGDAREAVRVYSVALDHLPGFALARKFRAEASWKLGDREGAEHDLEDYLEKVPDRAGYTQLADWYAEHGRFPAQLRVWRRIRMVAAEAADAALIQRATTMLKALQWVVSPADPVSLTKKDLADKSLGPARRSIARIAQRGGG